MQKTTMDEFFDGNITVNRMSKQNVAQSNAQNTSQYNAPQYNAQNNTSQYNVLPSPPSIKSSLSDLCTQFASVLQGKIVDSTGSSCTVIKMRNMPVQIMERKSKSALTLASMFSYEDLDADFMALNLGETVILQEELSVFIYTLEQNGIIVSALSNRWLYTSPQVMYVNFQSIDNPLIFAAKTIRAMNILK